METRKEKEIEHYDRKAEPISVGSAAADFERFEPQTLASFKFLYKILDKYCRNKTVLDYGCGNGVHLSALAGSGAKKITAIDLSEKSLSLAKNLAQNQAIGHLIDFKAADCEATGLADNSFDVVFDGGTFSSLDLKNVWPELVRLLTPDGKVIGIETFGHNPFTNLNRRFNKLTGKRTAWAAGHIFRLSDLESAKKYFGQIETRFFHLISWLAFPFMNWPGGRVILRVLEFFDKMLLTIPPLRRYGFKVVFILSKPKRII